MERCRLGFIGLLVVLSTCIPAVILTCTNTQFDCGDGDRCIPIHWVCDGETDCTESMADEANCDQHSCGDLFECSVSRDEGLFPYCVPQVWDCDQEEDCALGEDELCICADDEFRCPDGDCIPQFYVCDSVHDCTGGVDEDNCTYAACPNGTFTCGNHHCIPEHLVCNGIIDCGDAADEEDTLCGATVDCGTQFKCDNGQCIDFPLICNQQDDCGDNTDEIGCGINECQNTTLNTCSHGCTNIAIGFTCNCPTGYELMDDERTCQDIDECEAMPRGCTQVCENSLSSFTCSCNDTYHLDNAICRLNSGEEQPHIIFANRYYIRKMNLDGSGYVTLLNDTELVHVLDFDRVEQEIYYADAKTGEIKKINYTGTPEPSHAHVLIWHDLPLVEGLAVDWVARKIYWTDSKKMALNVAEMNGTHVKTFLDGNTTRPRGIVLHPAKGYVFWTDWGMEPFIGRVGMDGEGFVPLITEDLFWPNGIAIDLFIDKIWWCDAYLDHIEYADLDGGNRHVVLASLPHLYAISIWEEWVYWSDWNIKTVERANRFTGLGRENIRNISQQPFDIHVVQPSLQPVIANPCSDNNGGCSHLCLIKNGGGGFTCACPNNFYLNEDKKTCTANCSAAHYECGVTDHRCIPLTWVCDGEPDCKGGEDEKENCPTRNCAVGLFQCDNIEDCTYMTNVCDTYNDCPDGSDEKEEFCANVTCLDDQFRCNSGRCVPLSWKCDNEQDCSDGEDEPASCLIDQECEEGEFRCNNSLCIPESWFCDYDDDCGDASDEPRDKCLAETSCQAEWRRCPNNYRCIPELLLCDGNDDCRDNSDEDPAMCPDCDEEGDFTCDNGHCIPLRWQCDREEDCADGSDENDCELIASSCSEDEFACDNGYCIRRRYYCDHDDDCGDGSDEPDICPGNECEASEWQCASGHCIDADYKCDQERDCLDVSDEADCDPAQCQSYEFACTGTNVCVPLSWRCDTEDDCGDGSDETIAVCSQISCDGINRHRCDNGRCIFSYMLCNGVDNCGDGSDENDFSVCSPHPMCNATSFKCANLNCTSPGNLCNFADDCGDASDEIGCHHGSDGCASNNGGCMQNCTTLFDSDQQPSGHICTCRHGYIADPNQKTHCIDVDECATYTSGCQQGCSNTQGSFGCSCHDGVPSFSRVHVTTTEAGVSVSVCEPGDSDPGSEAATLLAVESSIRQIYTKAGQMTDAILYAKKIKSISVDTGVNSNGQALLYWTDNTAKAVYRSAMPMQYSEVALPQLVFAPSSNSDLSTPDGIAVDWVSKNLYLTDSVKGVIMVMKDDGRYPKTLISTQPRKPSAIAVAPELGWMFWCDPVFAKIEKAWMDGTHISSLYNREMIEPSGITVDYFANNRIYWVDAKKQSVETILPDGTGHFVVKQGIVHPYALDVFMNDLQWISILPDLTASVKKMDKYARGVMTTVESGFTVRPEDVVVYHSSKYPKLANRCFDKGCPALCLLVPDDAVCACPDSGEGSADSCTFTEQQPLAMPQLCHCYNEGVCVYDSSSLPVCQCKDGFEGAQCEKNVSGPSTSIGGSSMVAIIVSIVVILLVVLVALVAFYFLIYRRRLHEKSSGHGTVRMGAPGQNQNGDFPNAAGITGMEYNVENDVAATRFSNPMYDQLNSNQQQPQAGAPPKPDPHYEELPAKSEVGAPTSMYTQA